MMPDEQLSSPGVGEATFPLEIFELIINIAIDSVDHLSSANPSQLSRSDILSLGIVSRFFADICRPYLFRDVEIHMHRPLDKVQRLAQLIQNKPAIGYYVHNLSYTADVRYRYPEDTLLDGFLRLPAIKSLTLERSRRKCCRRPRVTDIPVSNDKLEHRTLLRHYISSNTLTSLHIHNMQNLPILQIINCPTLEFLTLYRCEYQSCDHLDSAELEILAKGFNLRSFILRYSRSNSDDGSFFPLLAFCPKLQSIDITNSSNFGPHPKSKFPALAKPLSSFKHVKVIKSQHGVDWTDFCGLADEAGVKAFPSLEDLSFEISDSRDISIGLNVLFNHIRSLIRLSVTIWSGFSRQPSLVNWRQGLSASSRTLRELSVSWQLAQNEDEALVSSLCDGLQSVSHENVIQSVRLEMTSWAGDNHLTFTQFNQWTRFDLLMTSDGQTAFPQLQTVKISISVYTIGDPESLPDADYLESLNKYKEGLNACLIRLHNLSDTIDVTCDVKIAKWPGSP